MIETEFAGCFFVVDTGFGLLVSASHVHSSVLNFDLAVGALHAVHSHDAVGLVRGVLHRLFLFKDEHAGLVVVQNRHTGARVLAYQSISSCWLVQLHEEVFIRLPRFIVNDYYFDNSFLLTALKYNAVINGDVVFVVSCSGSINCSNLDFSRLLALVYNPYLDFLSSFTDRVVEASETKVGVLLVII